MKPQAPPSSMLSRRTFAIARVACAALALLALGLFAAGLPALYDELSVGFDGDEVRANLAQIGLSTGFYAWYVVVFAIVLTVTHYAIATVIFLRRSDEPFPLLVALTLALLGANATRSINVLAAHNPIFLQPLLDFFNALTGATALLFIYLFPDGRFMPRWTRWPAVLAIAWSVSTDLFDDLQFSSEHWLYWLTLLGGPLIGLFAQVYRYRHVSSPVERQQTKWVVFGLVALIVGYAVVVAAYPVFSIGQGTLVDLVLSTIHAGLRLLIPLSFGIAILRYRLWDIDFIINRTLVYTALTASVVGLYIAMVGGLGALLQAPQENLLVSLLATSLVAVLFAPLRERLQRGVNRLMYGERDEPYAVISRLGQRLEATIAPNVVLEVVVETVVQALKLPYAAIALKREGGFETAAAHGLPAGEPTVLSLVYQREIIGQLILSPRAPGELFTPADRRLLEGVARQAAVAAHAVRLTADLQRARERLVTAREEERRRLRRDLHDDGLGSTLAGLTFGLDGARSLLAQSPKDADALLAELKSQAQVAMGDIRRLVYDLRPPALDDLGLVAALCEKASNHGFVSSDDLSEEVGGAGRTNRLVFFIEAPEHLPPVPAAVEVAAYRIAQEAMTNVARHARASACRVRLSLDDIESALELEIADDGVGMPEDRHAGVGMNSMRERAEELGGTWEVTAEPAGGTRVLARLPLPAARKEYSVTSGGESSWKAPASS